MNIISISSYSEIILNLINENQVTRFYLKNIVVNLLNYI